MNLNDQQKEAVEHIIGPLLILAGAGSGKTSVIQHRIAHMIEKGISPKNILAVTFTNKAAEELKERIAKAVGDENAKKIWATTFHALCVKLLREEGNYLTFIHPDFDSKFLIYDTQDAKSVLKSVIKDELGLDPKNVTPDGMLYYISMLKNEMVDLFTLKAHSPKNAYIDWEKAKNLIETKIPVEKRRTVEEVYEKYQERLAAYKAVDFDDLILHTITLFMLYPDVLKKWQERFQYIMVDEYQDTNHAQYILIKMLAEKYRNLGVVGDDSQSIYAFRGSDIRNILEFEQDYPDAHVIKLEENYRCTPIILQAANEVIANNKKQREKKLFTSKTEGERIHYYCALSERDEARYVANEIKNGVQSGKKYNEFAILFRTNGQSRSFEETFMRMSIPYQVVGGLKFYDRMEVKDIISYLKFIHNPQDVTSFIRIINTPKRGIGKKTVENLVALGSNGDFLQFLKEPEGMKLSLNAKNQIEKFVKLIEDFSKRKNSTKIGTLISEFIVESGYLTMLKESKEEKSRERLENISELVNIAMEMENESTDGSLITFLEHVALHSEADNGLDAHAVKLMTLHSAKGLEFPNVFLVGMEENMFPHKNSNDDAGIEEERRLCYVGITRAMKRLFITHARERTTWGKTEANLPSRFLYEFSEELIDPKFPLLKLEELTS